MREVRRRQNQSVRRTPTQFDINAASVFSIVIDAKIRVFQQYLRIADIRRERLNVADRRQAEWGTGLEAFEAKRS
jgi:hypothetical protein